MRNKSYWVDIETIPENMYTINYYVNWIKSPSLIPVRQRHWSDDNRGIDAIRALLPLSWIIQPNKKSRYSMMSKKNRPK